MNNELLQEHETIEELTTIFSEHRNEIQRLRYKLQEVNAELDIEEEVDKEWETDKKVRDARNEIQKLRAKSNEGVDKGETENRLG